MEIFVDFGLFELLAVSGLVTLGKAIHRWRATRWAFLVASVAAPAVLVFLAESELPRWVAALALATSLINVSMLIGNRPSPRTLSQSATLEPRPSNFPLNG